MRITRGDGSDRHLVLSLLTIPIVFFLLITSFPAGLLPPMIIGSVFEDRPTADSQSGETLWLLLVAGVATVIHLGVSTLALRKRRSWFAGLSGTQWLALAWVVYLLGLGMGVFLAIEIAT